MSSHLGTIIAAALLPLTPTTPADTTTAEDTTSGAYTCHVAWNGDKARMDFATGLFSDRWVDVTATVVWNQCQWHRSGKRFVNPLSYTVAYNVAGSGYNCGWPNEFDHVEYNGYFWDGSGANYNPGAVSLDCSSDTTNSNTFSLANAPYFHYCGGVPPKWRITVEGVFRGQTNDHEVLSNDMWDLFGPVGSTC